MTHPLDKHLADWLPLLDFAVMRHGFLPHGRDYAFVLQSQATYELRLTHVVDLKYETRLSGQTWTQSWDDAMTDYAAWEAAGEPDGYVWGANWTLAYPGLSLLLSDAEAAAWTRRIGKPMSAVLLETEHFNLRLVFHDAIATKLSDDTSLIDRAVIPTA